MKTILLPLLFFLALGTCSAQMVVTLTKTNVTCNGAANGTINTSVTGGLSPFNFDWQDLPGYSNPQNRTGLVPGTYTVFVTDATGNTASGSATITQPLSNISSTSFTNLSCAGQNTGTITLVMNGSSTQYSYDWADLAGTSNPQNRTGLAAGMYTVTTTNNVNACTQVASFTLTSPTPLVIFSTVTPVTCNGANNGAISLIPSGGVSPYTYAWGNGGGNSANRTNLAPGTYPVTVSDNNGCSTTASYIITQPAILALNGSTAFPLCYGMQTGAINLTAFGGTTPYIYDWLDLAGTNNPKDRTNLAAGSYSVTVTDQNGCTNAANFLIQEPGPLFVTASDTSPHCFGINDGTIDINASGGTGAFTFDWADIPGTNNVQDRSGLPGGTYIVTVSDAHQCSTFISSTLTTPTEIVNNFTSVNPNCAGENSGSLDLSITGGFPPYNFNWMDIAGNSNPEDRDMIPAGTYTLNLNDELGCLVTWSYTLTQPDSLSLYVIAQTNATCGGANGSATVAAQGGTGTLNYFWENGPSQPTYTGLSAGVYTASVYDGNSCSTSIDVAISSSSTLTATYSTSPINCYGATGSIALMASGGTPPYSYLWNTGSISPTLTGVPAGTYSVTLTDNAGCQNITIVNLTQPTLLHADVIGFDPTCNGLNNGYVFSIPSGGTAPYSFYWPFNNSTNDSIVNVNAGNYVVNIADANGCTATNSVILTDPQPIQIQIATTSVLCPGMGTGTATATTAGGVGPYTYTWSNYSNTSSISNLFAGVYSVLVSDNHGCTASQSTTITQPPGFIYVVDVTPVSCYGGSDGAISLTVTGGGSSVIDIIWSNGEEGPIDDHIPAGDYIYWMTNGDGCTHSDTISVGTPTAITVAESYHNGILCADGLPGTTAVIPTGGTPPYTYLWDSGETTAFMFTLVSGTHTVSITDQAGCTAEKSVNIPIVGGLHINSMQVELPTCLGAQAQLTINSVAGGFPPIAYQWSSGQTGVSAVMPTGTVQVHLSDLVGCTGDSIIQVPYSTNLFQNTTQTANPTCFNSTNGAIYLQPTGGIQPIQYLWSNSASGPSNLDLTGGNYSFTITDATGCAISDTVQLTTPPALNFTLTATAVTAPGANDGTISVSQSSGGSGPLSYFYPSGLDWSGYASGLAPGLYVFYMQDSSGCSVAATAIVNNANCALTASASLQNPQCFGASNGYIAVAVEGGIGTLHYLWSNQQEITPAIENLSAGTYILLVQDSAGCFLQDTFELVNPPFLISSVTDVVPDDGTGTGSIQIDVSGGTLPYAFNWQGPGGYTAAVQNPSGLAAGAYYCEIMDAHGCLTYPSNGLIEVLSQLPNAAFTSDVTEGCPPLTVHFMDMSQNAVAWEWTFASGIPATSTEQNPVVEFSGVGGNSVSLKVTNAAGQVDFADVPNYILVYAVPISDFQFTVNLAQVTFDGLFGNALETIWEFGDGQTSLLADPVHTYAAPGNYTVRLTVTNDCGVAVAEKIVTIITTSTQWVEENDAVQIFPNPNTGQFKLVLPDVLLENTAQITVENALGQRLLEKQITDRETTVDVTAFSPSSGHYFLKIHSGNTTLTRRIECIKP